MKMRFFTVLLSITLCAVLIRGDELSPLLNNCIITYMPRTAIKSADFNDDVADGNVRISIDHFDGLGRPTGKVLVGEGGGGEDLATLTIYNRRNLPCKQWQVMPFASNGGVLPAENLFSGACGQLYGDGEIGYTETEYEKLPSSRPASVRGPGINWKKKPVTSDYSINTDKNTCLHFTVYEDYITNTGAYPSGSLKVVTVTSADGAETTEFRNAYDKPVCVRRRIDANTCADTYYVYDNRGLLRVVLQPMASETFTTTRTSPMELDADLFRQYAFVYTYDIAGRVYTSRNPGQDEVRYVYDVMGHLTMKQDGVQRQSNTWTVIKYDSRYRPAVEGTVVTTKTHSQLWQRMDTSMLVEQVRPALDMNLFYTETSGLGTFTPHRAWLYDSYDFIPSWLNIKYLGFDIKKTDKANTLQTATVALRNNIPVVTAQWYDGYGRVTATIEYDVLGQNYCLRQYNTYDFRGNMTQSVTRMETLAEQQVQSSREYHLMTTYDRADRPVSVKYRTSPSAVWQELTNYAYDAVGRLNQEGGSAVKVQYGYDIRDHLTSISSPVFSQTMHYGIYNNAFNENYITAISEDYHDSAIAAVTNSYTYDNGGRLTGVSGARYTETYQYDLNSNVTKIVQNYNGSRIPFNNLSLLYDGNQVVTVTQTGTNLLAGELIAIPAGNHAQAIKYDANGRTIADASRNISSITYHPWLNLTNHITLGTGSSVDLQYTSGGELYQLSENERYIKQLSSIINPTDSTRKVTYGTRTVRTDRYGNFENRTGTGWRLYTPAGYYSWTDSTNHYVVRDYLGSTRVVYKPVKKSTRPLLASPDLAISSGSYTVEQRTGYFANGTPVNLSEGSSTTRLHTGKEWLNLEGIGLYDNAARLHDPLLGRFTTADALADKYHYLSPYTHCAGNPVNYLDLDGNDIYTFNDQGEIKITPHDTEDIIRFDENGSDVLTFPKGTIIKHTYIENIKVWVENESKYKYYNVDLLEVRGDDAAMDLYYTLQSRINVEFTLQMMGEEGDKGFNAITTSHSINTDVGTGFVNTNKYFYDYTIRKHFHNHPSNSNNPSKPDVTLWTEIDNHSNICRKYIYTTTEGFVEYRQIFKDGVINYERVY